LIWWVYIWGFKWLCNLDEYIPEVLNSSVTMMSIYLRF
jgi:hypothetical protein